MATYTNQSISDSLKGINKKFNEDNYLTIEEKAYNIYAIFDGVGSAKNSKEATELAKKIYHRTSSIVFE